MNIRQMYAAQNEEIQRRLEKEKADINEVIRLYSEGVSIHHISILTRLDDEEIGYILAHNMKVEHWRKRKKVQTALKYLVGLPKGEVIPKMSVEAAKKLVERKVKKGRIKSNTKSEDEGR